MVIEAQEEARLVEEARRSPDAFARLYDEYLPAVYGYVVRRVNNREIAEDITSQVWEKALRSLKGLREGASFKGWLFRVAGNTITDYYRTKGRRQAVSIEEAGEVANGKSAVAVAELESKVSVRALLAELPEGHREALTLHYLEGLSVEQMAEALGSTPNACYMKVYRATKALADALDKKGIRSMEEYIG
ncbi:MAG: RNA polymerase sigma factor [Actinobacteria bacterium]|nr:RNA polymerase sigma factor [Actinomycetota bacterium]